MMIFRANRFILRFTYSRIILVNLSNLVANLQQKMHIRKKNMFLYHSLYYFRGYVQNINY